MYYSSDWGIPHCQGGKLQEIYLWASLWCCEKIQNEWTGRWLYFSFTFWLNWQYLLHGSYYHMTCHPGGWPWELNSPKKRKTSCVIQVSQRRYRCWPMAAHISPALHMMLSEWDNKHLISQSSNSSRNWNVPRYALSTTRLDLKWDRILQR